MITKADPSINDGIDKTYRIYPDTFSFTEPYTCYACHNSKPFYPGCILDGLIKRLYDVAAHSDSAITSFTSGIILFIMPSIPAFRVIIEEGQPLQLPCMAKLTVPAS